MASAILFYALFVGFLAFGLWRSCDRERLRRAESELSAARNAAGGSGVGGLAGLAVRLRDGFTTLGERLGRHLSAWLYANLGGAPW